jgi:hypothetical protein
MKTEIKMAVFIDHTSARLISCEDGVAQFTETIESGKESHVRHKGEGSNQARFGSYPYQVSNNEYSTNMQEQEIRRTYFHKVQQKLLPFDEILLFGAGQAKKEMHNYLMEQGAFRNKTINLQNSDYLTDNQLLEMVRNYFNGN